VRSLLTTYRQGLEPRLRLQLACYDDSRSLENLIQLSIRCATRMLSCFEEQPQLTRFTPYSRQPPEPCHADVTHLSFAERQRRMNQKLCLYCGTGGYDILMPSSPSSTPGECYSTGHAKYETTLHCCIAYCL